MNSAKPFPEHIIFKAQNTFEDLIDRIRAIEHQNTQNAD